MAGVTLRRSVLVTALASAGQRSITMRDSCTDQRLKAAAELGLEEP